MDAPMLPQEVSPGTKKGVFGLLLVVILFVVIAAILILVEGFSPNQGGFVPAAAAILVVLITTAILLNWLRRSAIDEKVKWLAVVQSIALIVLGASLLAVAYAPVDESTYVLGGTLSGDANGQVTIKLNGEAQVLKITAMPGSCNSFLFPDRLKKGSAYTVTVVSPTSGACSVTGGVGTISRDTAPVRVNCKALYPVEGAVTGATKEGLNLFLNEGSCGQSCSIQVPASAARQTWKFTKQLSAGDPYKVTCGADPQTSASQCTVNGMTCTIPANGVGTMPIVDTVLINCT